MNIVELMGRLTRDPYYNNGALKLTLAIDRMPDKNGNKITDFPSVTVFGKQAEAGYKYLRKGRQVTIQATIQTGSYEGADGKTVYTQDIVAYRVEYNDQQQSVQPQPAPPQEQTQAQPQQQTQAQPQERQVNFTEIDDSTPF